MIQQKKQIDNERGAISILFCLLLFSIFGIAGVLIDVGLARTTQAIMQTAVDGSALTGLRLRDDAGVNENDRREAVAISVARNFSHQVRGDAVSFPNDDRQFGAGPIIGLDAGTGTERAGQLVTIPVNNQYLPELELNLDNEEHGDMVSGDYDLSAIHTAGALADPAHDETGGYQRTGFTPDAAAPFNGNAFLVRLRRTPDLAGLDNQVDVSSSGPPLPFLFSRGAAIKYDESYDVGAEGLSVRATAIAMARPAKTVGTAQVDIKGVTPFVLSKDFWDDIVLAGGIDSLDVALSVQVDGSIILNPDTGVQAGRFIFSDSANADVISIGMVPGGATPAADVSAVSVDGYVPIVDEFGGTEFIIGFGRVQMIEDDDDDLAPFNVTLRKFASQVADENASASVNTGFDGLAANVIEFLIDSNQTEGDRLSDPLLVPTLVR